LPAFFDPQNAYRDLQTQKILKGSTVAPEATPENRLGQTIAAPTNGTQLGLANVIGAEDKRDLTPWQYFSVPHGTCRNRLHVSLETKGEAEAIRPLARLPTYLPVAV
jgi:hypothetical protein